MQVSSEGVGRALQSESVSRSMSRSLASNTGLTNTGHRAAAMYASS